MFWRRRAVRTAASSVLSGVQQTQLLAESAPSCLADIGQHIVYAGHSTEGVSGAAFFL